MQAEAILHPCFAFRQGLPDLLLPSAHASNFGSLFTLSSPHRLDKSPGILVLLQLAVLLLVVLLAQLLHLQSLSQERSLCIRVYSQVLYCRKLRWNSNLRECQGTKKSFFASIGVSLYKATLYNNERECPET